MDDSVSMGNSRLKLSNKSSKVVGMFLSTFDVKSGYKIAWSKSRIDLDFATLDYKSLPSGIHESNVTSVMLSHKYNGELFYGVARFRRYIIGGNTNLETDRSKVKMYSVGVICEGKSSRSKANDHPTNGCEHLEALDSSLKKFLANEVYEDFSVFESLFDKISNSLFPKDESNFDHHPLSHLHSFLHKLGPLIFVLYKESLLRRRIMFFNKELDNYQAGAFTYLLSLISEIPEDVRETSTYSNLATYSIPLYQLSLQDLDSSLLDSDNWIAVTNDEIIKYQSKVYDIAAILPTSDTAYSSVYKPEDLSSPNVDEQKQLRAPIKDYWKFRSIYRETPEDKTRRASHENLSRRDDASIQTSTSFFSFFKPTEPSNEFETAWWLKSATSPMSWRESFWSAFAWFASAGEVAKEEPEEVDNNYSLRSSTHTMKLEMSMTLIESFHLLTKKWFYIVNEVVNERLEEELIIRPSSSQLESNTKKIDLEMTYYDITDMELDPYSEQDLEFVRAFVLQYWGDIVENVTVGLGFVAIFC